MSDDATPSPPGHIWLPARGARYPALLAAICIALGILLGDALDRGALIWCIASIALGGAAFVLTLRPAATRAIAASLAMSLALTALGAWRITIDNQGRPSPAVRELTANGRRVEIFARVDGVPYQKPGGWRAPLDLVSFGSRSANVPADGRVLLTSIPSLQGLRYGDYIRFAGRVYAPSTRRNAGGFDYAEYLHRQGFDATVRPETPLSHWPQGHDWSLPNIVEPARSWIRTAFTEHLPDTQQALVVGLILGDTDKLPRSIYTIFRDSGTSHLLAVSGANVWLIVGMLLWPMYRLGIPRWPRTIAALVVIVLFSFLTRNEPSVVRASLMVGLMLAGQLLWRPVAPLNAVGAAALAILLVEPSHFFRPGFQLSFAAVIGILIAVSRVEPHLRGFLRKKWPYLLVLFLTASVAATFATAPLSAWHFGTVPVAGFISNLLMVPLAGAAGYLGVGVLACQLVSSTLAAAVAWLLQFPLHASLYIAGLFARMPGAVLSWPNPSIFTIGLLVVVLVLMLNWRRRYSWFRPAIYGVVFFTLCATIIRIAGHRPAHVSISLLDTGGRRIALMNDGSDHTIGLVDDPGLDDELDQWIVRPFSRAYLGVDTVDRWDSWRRVGTDEGDVPLASIDGCRWRRFSSAKSDRLGSDLVIADFWQFCGGRVLMFREVPERPISGLLRDINSELGELTLVVPATAPTAWVRAVIDSTDPARVVFYGESRFRRRPEERLAFWRLRYLDVNFFSSDVHGGISLELAPAGLAVRTAIAEVTSFGE